MTERNLPPLLDAAGKFPAERRETFRRLFAQEVFGVSPAYNAPVCGTLQDRETYPGLGCRETVELRFQTPQGAYAFPLYMYWPEQAEGPLPMVLFICNRPRRDTPMTLPPGLDMARLGQLMAGTGGALPGPPPEGGEPAVTRGCTLDSALDADNWPVEMLLQRGVATAAFYTEDLEPDRCTDGKQGILCHFDAMDTRGPERWGAIAAWAFGASRALDYLTADARTGRDIAVAGHSRGGKTALWCAANDPRVTCCYANNSGCTGAALSRGKRGEGILQINTLFPYWFCGNYKLYNGHAERLPVDQHMLLALVAPRLLYLASATEDLWSDPEAEFDGAAAASPAWQALGCKGLGCAALPAPGSPSHTGRIGYHVRAGGHALTREDWALFCDFWQAHRTADKI